MTIEKLTTKEITEMMSNLAYRTKLLNENLFGENSKKTLDNSSSYLKRTRKRRNK